MSAAPTSAHRGIVKDPKPSVAPNQPGGVRPISSSSPRNRCARLILDCRRFGKIAAIERRVVAGRTCHPAAPGLAVEAVLEVRLRRRPLPHRQLLIELGEQFLIGQMLISAAHRSTPCPHCSVE